MNFDAAAIARATGGRVAADAASGPIETDTRRLNDGSWFLALVGERFDGHDFIDRAAVARGIVVDRPIAFSGGVVVVEDTTRALQDLGRAARARLSCPVIGLTGSSGKTTTRALIALAVGACGRVHQTVGNLNNHLGVPMTLVATPADADAVVVEMGTSSPGEIGFLAELATPSVRLITNVGPAHLEELGGLDGVAVEKGALFATARPGDVLAVNIDDPRVAAMEQPRGTRAISWGRSADAVIRLVSVVPDVRDYTSTAVFSTPAGEVTAHLPVLGEHVALDAAGALAVAHALGLDLHDAAARLAAYAPVGMRQRIESIGTDITAINDAYNANPASMRASLEMLAGLPGRRVAVLGDMLELGPGEHGYHVEVAKEALTLGLDLVVLVGSRMARAGRELGCSWVAEDPEAVVDPLEEWLREGDHILFKGSRGARVERILLALQTRQEAKCST